MRLGGPLFTDVSDPDNWAKAVREKGYGAAYCPVGSEADDATVAAFRKAADDHDVLIAEVGAFGNNPISPDSDVAARSIERCAAQLDLADRIGANCCVNIAGSRHPEQWHWPHDNNLTRETFDIIVHATRCIIDAVKPTRTFYTLETMPWIYPTSPQQYIELIKAIDRKRIAVHFDPVNMINSPDRYYDTAAFVKHCFDLLGPLIKSCHAKDIILRTDLTVHLDECAPGDGLLHYPTFLNCVDALDANLPVMLEHLPDENSYDAAAAYVRRVATAEGIALR